MGFFISVENIKCGGCANSIRQKLTALEGIESVDVDVDTGQITISLASQVDQDSMEAKIKAKLLSIGYPEVGTVEGLTSVGVKAKSFVSCAIGKMSDKK
ncbi:MAG: copper chaperone [Thiomicrorhabdus sp.]|nr:MAG: copper chaperone [Thiomicrorhabdus sp.]